MRYQGLLVLTVLAYGAPYAHAQVDTSIVSANRRIDWSQAGVPGGIPNRTRICATFDPGATASQINAAIASCSDGVVFLNPGTYNLSSGLNFGGASHVTLRGAGPRETVLKFTGADPCGGFGASVCLKGTSSVGVWGVPAANIRNWTAGYAKDTTRITLDSVGGISVGMILVLDQLDDMADTGGIIVNGQSRSPFSIEGAAPGRPNRTQQQFVRVTAIDGTQVTVSPGLYMPNWRSSQAPQAWFWGTTSGTAWMDGIEDLTLDHSANSSERTGVMIWNAYGCWVRNVKSVSANRNHVWLYQSAHGEVRDSYFFGTKNAASQSYGVESFMTSDNLVINNIFQHVTTPVMTGPSAGNVTAYNYLIDMYYSTVPNWMMAGMKASHDTGTGMNLFEGNEGNSFGMDLYHGPGALATAFRNYFSGRDGARTSNTAVVSIWAYNRFVNFVGNVLGTPGYHLVYEDSRGPQGQTGSPNRSIYLLGYSGVEESQSSGISYDLMAVTSLLRWGNFDYATAETRWDPAEIPADNAVPAAQALPASLFLTSKPSWWGAMPWPAIGPDVTGGDDPAGHVYKIPAHACYDESPKQPDGSLDFDAAQCYASAPPDGTPPTVSIAQPADGATVSGTIVVTADASDDGAVAAVRFTLDGADLGADVTAAPYSVSWDTSQAANGPHSLSAIARDAAGNTATSVPVAITVSNGAQEVPPPADLVAAYDFNEGSGASARDRSIYNNTALLSEAIWTVGPFGAGVLFNGASSFVEAADIDALTLRTEATFQAWVLLSSVSTETASIFNKWSQTADDEFLFGLGPDRRLYFAWHTTGGATWGTPAFNHVTGAGQIPLGVLTHVAVVRSGASLRFYINGALDASRDVMDVNPFRNGLTTLRIGGQGRGARARFFGGVIDEPMIYGRALTEMEIHDYVTSMSPSLAAGRILDARDERPAQRR